MKKQRTFVSPFARVSAFLIALSTLAPSPGFADNLPDPVGAILKRCDTKYPLLKSAGNYGLLLVEGVVVAGGLWMIKYGVTKGNVNGSQDDLVSLTGTAVISAAIPSEVKGRRVYFIDSFDETAMRGLATEVLSGIPGIYTQRLNQSCDAANGRRPDSTFVVSCENVLRSIAQKLNSDQPCDSVEFVEKQLKIIDSDYFPVER